MSAGRGTNCCGLTGFGRGGSLLLLVAVMALASCQNPSQLPPIEQLEPPPDIRLHHHTVSRGDTLYSIAWRYGMDYHQLASINNIRAPYTIYAGQKLDLGTGGQSDTVAAGPGTTVMAVPDTSSGVTEVGGVTEVTEVRTVPEAVGMATVGSVEQSAEPSVEHAAPSVASGGNGWIWPAPGRIVSSFSATDPRRKGIDLDGKLGEPVMAARGGNVVYAGSGLTGYGELVIVKHDESFLSAYGHNSRLLVKEGETVRAGQKIAEIGSSGTDSNKLHFEIRREGKPVDPLQYLPKR